jgi:hypothetical protein
MIADLQKWKKTAQMIINSNLTQRNVRSCEFRSSPHTPSLYDNVTISELILEVVDSVKILEVTLQNNLKWNSHVSNIIKKASKRLYFLIQLN